MSKIQKAGFCPVCGCSDLEYGANGWDGNTIAYKWYCPVCKSSGAEVHILTFLQHRITVRGESAEDLR